MLRLGLHLNGQFRTIYGLNADSRTGIRRSSAESPDLQKHRMTIFAQPVILQISNSAIKKAERMLSLVKRRIPDRQ